MGLTAMYAMKWIESLSQAAASSFISGIWQGLLLAAAVALCLRLMPKMTAAIRFTVWTAVFLVIVLLPLLLHLDPAGLRRPISSPGAMIQIDMRWSFAIAALWVLLSLVRASRLAVSIFQLCGLWKRATPVEAGAASVSLPSGIASRKVQLCTSSEVDRPSVIGFFSPRILIPVWLFEKLTPQELGQIVLHEIGHLNRADDWINLVQKISLVLFPLNPVLMWIERRLCFERELACDEGVLRFTKPATYASCLTGLAESRLARRSVSLSLGAWERQPELTRRIHSILRRGESMTPLQARLVLSAMVLALLGGATGLSRCPQFVAFSGRGSGAPIPVQALRLPATEYRPVVFHPSDTPHETLLKATVPVGPAMKPVHATAHRKPAGGHEPAASVQHTPAVRQVKQASDGMQRWVVLTSFHVTSGIEPANPIVRPGVVLTVDGEHAIAALPTDDGWLVIQL